VAEAIVNYANNNDCDIIIQMNKKELSIGEMFSGDLTLKVIETSNIPVLSVKPMVRVSVGNSVH
jgi:nucleotide-binding universal stress UspA family protein